MNPMVMLGGIVAGIILAGVGALTVPGWVAGAYDGAAENDLSHARIVQAQIFQATNAYAPNATALRAGARGVTFTPGSATLEESTSSGGRWCTVVRSQSKTYFAASNNQVNPGKGTTIAAAKAAAACS